MIFERRSIFFVVGFAVPCFALKKYTPVLKTSVYEVPKACLVDKGWLPESEISFASSILSMSV